MPTVPSWNVYVDESCHLEADRQSHMVIGALACPSRDVRRFSDELRDVKRKHGIHPKLELKWVKVSSAKLDLYRDYLNVFCRWRGRMRFRSVVIPKAILDHEKHEQTHDDFYYKMSFLLLAHMPLPPRAPMYVYLDMKDTRSEEKIRKLEHFLKLRLDRGEELIKRVQHIRSEEVELAQLVDLLIGAVGYANRGLTTSKAKAQLVAQIEEYADVQLTRSTAQRAIVNVFHWQGSGA